jgi:putative hydrolase of the HAD superfamily
MLSVLTIDFWNTLFDSTGGEPRNAARRDALLEAIRTAGNECPDERFDEVYRGIWKYFDEHWLERQRTPTSREMIDEMLRRLEYALDENAIESVAQVFTRGVLDHPPEILPGVPEALAELKGRGLGLAVISDTAFSPGSVLRELMEHRGIAGYFDVFVFSDETGVAKPHPEAFRRALEPFGAAPAQACHVGDIERTDIRGARLAGMKAILFRGDPTPAKHAEAATQADATVEHWDEIIPTLTRLEELEPPSDTYDIG